MRHTDNGASPSLPLFALISTTVCILLSSQSVLPLRRGRDAILFVLVEEEAEGYRGKK